MPEELRRDFEKVSEEELKQVAEAMQEVASTHPWRVLKGITGLGIERGSVEEELTNRKPPMEIAPDAEIIAIDECLGLYRSRRKQIVLFRRGIAEAAKILNCEAEDLQHVVSYHEWGHAILHAGADKDGRGCDMNRSLSLQRPRFTTSQRRTFLARLAGTRPSIVSFVRG